MATTFHQSELLLAAANLLRSIGASQVFVFGSVVRGELRPDSDIDMAVSGLPAKVYFFAVSKVSDLLGRPVDLDDETPLVRHLLGSEELIRDRAAKIRLGLEELATVCKDMTAT